MICDSGLASVAVVLQVQGVWSIVLHHDSDRISCITGLSSDKELMPRALELSQGDRISGKVLRQEVATVVVAALSSPAAVGEISNHGHQQYCMQL